VCLLEEDLSSINNRCLPHQLQITEQLMRSIGLLSYKIGALDAYNQELKEYDPESFTYDRNEERSKNYC